MRIPPTWMPRVTMKRVICHWSAGTHEASWLDRKHYHLIIEGDGNLVRGDRSIADNAAPIRGNYAAHTLRCNTGSIGVSLACMAGARERPFTSGSYPMTQVQWKTLAPVVAELCRVYEIPVTPQTVLSHAEVEDSLGIKQRGKWDYTRLPFDPSVQGAREVGDKLRREVQEAMDGLARPTPPIAEPTDCPRAEAQAHELIGFVTASWLNFRRDPNGEIVGGLPRGTRIAIQDVDGAWYQARTPGGYLGWVHGRYVALD